VKPDALAFDASCRQCDRLRRFLQDVSKAHPDYFSAPVPSFGDPQASLLVVGLAPGMHGANRTGRPFTGDHAGVLLYETLHRFGFSNQPTGISTDDGLALVDCRITNAVRCLPPDNKPLPAEVAQCNAYLRHELSTGQAPSVVVALGQIAHQAVLRALKLKVSAYPFGHGVEYLLPTGQRLLGSYHCSRYNTQTRRLTPEMFQAVFHRAERLLESERA
jgi:uracil-DNA glycosylase family 4